MMFVRQVFRKSVEQTWCVRESVSALGALVGAARAATQHAAAVTQPKGLTAAQELYNDVTTQLFILAYFGDFP